MAEEKQKTANAKTPEDLKSTDTVIVGFRVPTVKSVDGEAKTTNDEYTKQHVKFLFWKQLASKNGNFIHTNTKGAKLLGYLDEKGNEVLFK